MPTVVWPGTPGEKFTNDGQTILYQLICSWSNTCGTCAQFHLAIAKWWGKFHTGCNCRSEPVYPGKTSLPYEDWREIAKSLSPQQHKALVGVSNAKLIDAGVVKWDDVVTPTRIRPLREVTSRSKLTVEQMTKAGVKKDIAERAHQSVNTPEHVLAQQHRQQLIQQIQALGVPPKTITDMLAQGLAGRIGLGTGVPGSGPQSMPRTGPTREGWIRKVMGMLTGLFRRTRASMQPKTNKP